MKKTSVGTFLSFAVGIAACGLWEEAAAAAIKPEQVTLPATAAAYVNYQSQLVDGSQLAALDFRPASVAMLEFAPDALKPVGRIKIAAVTLNLAAQYVREVKTATDKVVPPVLEVHLLRRPAAAIRTGKQLPVEARDYDSAPLAVQALPADFRKGDRLAVTLPISDGTKLAELLNNGLLLRLRPKGPSRIVQINFFTVKEPANQKGLMAGLNVVFTPETAKLELFPAVRPQAGKFVTRRGPDFYYDGNPIRFMGMNFGVDSLRSYEAVDNIVRRLRNMNINAIRLWATGHPFYTPETTARKAMVTAVKGDGSKLDLYDYFVFRCQEAGIFIHNTSLGSHTPPMEYWPGNKVILKRQPGEKYDHNYFNVFPIMTYLDETWIDARIAHIRMYLNRVNPYTGQRYAEMPVFATWELTNENHTVPSLLEGKFDKWPEVFRQVLTRRWNQWLARKYRDDAGLLKAWGRLEPGETLTGDRVRPGPIYKEAGKMPLRRGEDFVTFVVELFVGATKQFEAAARSCAPQGVGVNVAPFVANTHADLNMHGQYASAACDFVSVGTYQTGYTTDPSKPFYPWRPVFSERPYFYNLNYQTVKDKPFVVYENSFFRPYPYRAEWVPAVALLGAGLGWDAIYYYIFGQNWAICDDQVSDLSFLAKPLAIPPSTSHDGYCVGFHHGNDEVMMATLAVTSQAFINGIKPNRETVVVTYGGEALRRPDYRNYKPSGPVAKVPSGDKCGGENEWYKMPDLYRRLMHSSVRKQLQLAFDPSQKEAVKITGELSALTVNHDQDREKLQPSDDIIWEPGANRIVLDCSHSKIAVGILRDGYQFKEDVRLGRLNRDFAFFGIASRDGKALAESCDIILALASTSANTGYLFDPKKIKGSTLGHINGIVNRGTAPVVVERVGAEVLLPVKDAVMECYNFAGYCYRSAPVDGKVVIAADEPLFVARIVKKTMKERVK